MANSRQSTRSRVVASTSPPPTLVAPVADPARGVRRARPNASSAVADVLFPSSIDAHFALVRARLRPLDALERLMKIIPIHSSRRPRSSTLPRPRRLPSLAVRPATSKPPPRRARAAHLHDGELPRSPPPFSLVPFACDDAAAALNIAARPVPPTTLSARRVSRVSRVSLARARAGMKQSPNGGPVSRATTDSRRPRARSPPSTTERERERSPVSSLARLARSLARHDRARPRRASHCRRRGGWLSCRGTEGDTLTSHRPS